MNLKPKKRYKALKLLIMASLFSLLTVISHQTLASSKLSKKKKQNSQIAGIHKAILNAGYPDNEKGLILAQHICEEAKKHNLDPKLLVAIIKVESSFDQDAISRTGDISLAQINVPTWNEEFERLEHELIDKKKLSQDSHYAIKVMSEILAILAERHKTKSDWYGYYHSGNSKHKRPYVNAVKRNLAQINYITNLIQYD